MRTMGLILMVLALSGMALAAPEKPAKKPKASPPPPAAAKPAAPEGAAPAAEPQEPGLIEQIKKENEAVITGRHFSYDPAGRRDPFEPLVKPQSVKLDAKRPKGIAGMVVSEIDLKGVALDTRGNPVAMFRGSDNRGYTLREGDMVYDGRVISIDPRRGVVVFRQQVDDPRRIKPWRDVIKRLTVSGGEEDSDSSAEEGGA